MRVTEVRKAGWHKTRRLERADIGYDEYGQRIYIKYGNGVETNYTYDENMRWLKHIGTENKYGTQYQNIVYSFDDVGNVEKYTNDCMNGSRYRTEQKYTYDALYQLIAATGTTEDNPYAIPNSPDYRSNYEQNFSFDAIGNMTRKKSKETINPAIQKKGGDDLNYEFTYEYDIDYAHRLKRAGSEQKGWRYYTYDANGNVTSESDGVAPNEETTTLTPVTVTTQTNEEGSSVYEADYAWAWAWSWGGSGTSGNKPAPNNKRTYEWNSRNLLMRSVALGYDTRYAYSADGNRAAKWTSTKASETLYFNTMWTWHIDKGLSQEQQGQYSKHIYLGETRIVTKQTSDLEESYGQSEELHHQYYYHPDHLGSAQLVTDYGGNEYQRIEYTPYGELWVEKKTANEKGMRYLPYKFTAKEQDEETGLYYYGARYLDAKYSRWLSTDPAVSDYVPQAPVNDEARKHNQNLPGMGGVFNHINCNLYAYGANNPVHYIDPDGRKSVNFNQKEYIRQQIYAQTCLIDAGFRHLCGKIGNAIVNILTGNASYQVYAKASLNILNFNCTISDLKIGSKGQDLSFTLQQKVADKFLESFETLIETPMTLTTSKLKVNIGGTSFTFQTDGANLKVNIDVGKSKSIDLGALGEGKINICTGINITTNMDNGPLGTIRNGKKPIIESDKAAYNYYTFLDRVLELMK